MCVHTSLDSLAGNFLGINFEANQKSCTLQLVIQHCTSAALANVATLIRSSIKPCQTIIQDNLLLIAPGSLPLAHNAQHSTSKKRLACSNETCACVRVCFVTVCA